MKLWTLPNYTNPSKNGALRDKLKSKLASQLCKHGTHSPYLNWFSVNMENMAAEELLLLFDETLYLNEITWNDNESALKSKMNSEN